MHKVGQRNMSRPYEELSERQKRIMDRRWIRLEPFVLGPRLWSIIVKYRRRAIHQARALSRL